MKNAIKFTIGGLVRITVTFDDTVDLLKVQVLDTGKRIIEEGTSKLFQMFGKLKRTAKMNSEGIGMGLMICQKLVDKNGGTISVHSEGENKGSVFSFTMKMKRYEEDALQRVIEADEEQSSLDGGSDDSVSKDDSMSKDDSDGQDEDATKAVAPIDRANYNTKLIDDDDQEQTIVKDIINYSFK